MVNSINDSQQKCRICYSNKFSRWGVNGGYALYKCSGCGLVFFWPYPTQKDLDEFYNSHYHDTRGYDGNTRAGELRKQMYLLDVRELESTIPVGGKFLDVGCAEGVFLTCLSDDWEKFGIDVSKDAISSAAAKKGITATTHTIEQLNDNYFDVIHLRGVFEHILFPDEFFQVAVSKLKTGGHLIISTTPNIEGLVPRLFRGKYRLILPNEHVNYFSPKSIRVLAKRYKLSETRLTFPYFGTPYSSFLKDLFNIPVNLVTGKGSPPFWKNIFSIYLKKQ